MIYDVLDRSIIQVSGPDAAPFLQGLITQDIAKVTDDRPQYSLLLNAQGRYAYDFFVSQKADVYELEVHASCADMLLRRLKAYAFRSPISLGFCDRNLHVLVTPDVYGGACYNSFQDPRLPALGWRTYIESSLPDQQPWDYRSHVLSLGVPEGVFDLIPDKSIPLECHMEELHGVSFTKGCYLGQELTARTKHRGVVRKRLFSGRAFGPLIVGDKILVGDSDIGQIQSVYKDLFFARLQEEALFQALELKQAVSTVSGIQLEIWIPKFLNAS